MSSPVLASLSARQGEIADLLAGACRSLSESRDWEAFDLAASFDDTWDLSQRRDCCYDRPSIGLNYALWYHARRTHDAVRMLVPAFESEGVPHEILDLGCGTGATAWALALAATSGMDLPERVRIVCVDGSPPMLGAAEHLWNWVRRESPLAGEIDRISVEWMCRSWTQPGVKMDEPDIVASYLFDDSDGTRLPEVSNSFHRLALHHRARLVHLASSQAKRKVLAEVSASLLGAEEWATANPVHVSPVWNGELAGLADLRQRLLVPAGIDPRRLSRKPTWTGNSTLQVRLRRVPSPESLDIPDEAPLVLDNKQAEASEPRERLTMVVGSAGSGKSRVLIERAARTITEVGPPTRMLVTTFNKLLVFQLSAWFEARMARNRIRLERDGSDGDIWFRDTRIPDQRFVRFLNWDKVPTRLFGVDGISNARDKQRQVRQRAEHVVREHRLPASRLEEEFLEPEFLLAEMQRVIWGLGIRSLDEYLDVSRIGRRQPLGRQQRELVWEVLMGDGHPDTFSHVRQRASRCTPTEVYTHVFIDECQDFTPADFRLAARLVPDAAGVFAAGDAAQSMHLGPAYRPPGMLAADNGQQRRWLRHDLGSTYRLPLRIAEAVAPIAREIGRDRSTVGPVDPDGEPDVIDLEAVSGATLGTRPILVCGGDDEVVRQLVQITTEYGRLFEATEAVSRRVTFAEGGASLCKALRPHMRADVTAEVRSMNKIKGLERPMVVWPLGVGTPAEEADLEWIFTILTRTTGVIVVVLDPTAGESQRQALRLLRSDRVLPWTSAARELYEELVS